MKIIQKKKFFNFNISTPHPERIISLIYATLFGNSYIDSNFPHFRISFLLENTNVEFLISI